MTDADQKNNNYHTGANANATYEERNSNMEINTSSTIISQRSATATTATAVANNDGNYRRQGGGCEYKVKITDLPEEIIMKLQELVPVDYISLMHVSSFFFAMKGRWHYYKFKTYYSRQYHASQAFREHVQERIGDISKRLSLNVSTLNNISNITDVSALGGVHTLDLSYCRNITDVSALGGVHTLNLCGFG